MFVRISSASLSRWGRSCLIVSLGALPVFASCAQSEDTEPFVPSVEGAKQPRGAGALITEDEACDRLRRAAESAYASLRCDDQELPACPAFLRPGGGSGCYEYREASVAACEQAYEDVASCRTLAPCIATAELNTELPTCEQVTSGGGAGGAGGAGGSPSGGASSGAGGSGGSEAGAAGAAPGGAAGNTSGGTSG